MIFIVVLNFLLQNNSFSCAISPFSSTLENLYSLGEQLWESHPNIITTHHRLKLANFDEYKNYVLEKIDLNRAFDYACGVDQIELWFELILKVLEDGETIHYRRVETHGRITCRRAKAPKKREISSVAQLLKCPLYSNQCSKMCEWPLKDQIIFTSHCSTRNA